MTKNIFVSLWHRWLPLLRGIGIELPNDHFWHWLFFFQPGSGSIIILTVSLHFRPSDKLPFFKQCCLSFKNKISQGWKGGSAAKSKYCSSRGSEFCSQHPHWCYTTAQHSSSRKSSALFCPLQALHSLAHIHTDTHLETHTEFPWAHLRLFKVILAYRMKCFLHIHLIKDET